MKQNWLKNTSVVISLTRKENLNEILKRLLKINFKEIIIITNIKNIKINKPIVKFINLKNLNLCISINQLKHQL